MSQKGVIRRIPKYRVEGHMNHKEEIVIQARLDSQIRGWMMQDKQNNVLQDDVIPKENELLLVDSNVYEVVDLEQHRMQRTNSDLLNTYLIEELAFFMSIIDIVLVLFLQIYMNWTSQYTFARGYCIAIAMLLQIHTLYCISVYMMEKHKGHQMDLQEQVRFHG